MLISFKMVLMAALIMQYVQYSPSTSQACNYDLS